MEETEVRNLEQELEEAQKRVLQLREERDQANALATKVKQERADVYEQFTDLKTRLNAAETSNQFMRGYLARVQEDDVVREELITAGEPGGEQQLLPKRKPTRFERPSDFTEFRNRDEFGYERRDQHRKPKHWITY